MKKEEILKLIPQLAEEDAEKILKLYDESVAALKEELETVKSSSIDDLALDEAYEKGVKDAEEKFAQAEYEKLLSAELENSGAKSATALKALLDLEKIGLLDGKLTGFSEQIENLKNEYGFLFEEDENKPKFTAEGQAADAEIDFSKLSYKDRLKLYKENPELYKTFVR